LRAGLGRAPAQLFLTLAALFLAAPLAVVTGVSFNGNARMSFPPQNPGLRWYAEFFGDPAWVGSVEWSLLIAASAAVLAVTLALPMCYAAWRHGSRLAQGLSVAAVIPFTLPAVVMAILFLVFWSGLRHVGHVENTVVAHAVVFLACPLVVISLGLRSVDPALLEVARTLGAREGDLFRTVVLPIILPYIVCGLVFVFILSLNEYIIAYMCAGFSVETLPIKVFNNLRMGFQPTMCVGAVLFMLVGVAGFGLIAALGDLPKLLGARE